MIKFDSHSKLTKMVSIVSILTGLLGLAIFLFFTLSRGSEVPSPLYSSIVLVLMLVGISAGIGLWKRYVWALNLALAYFAVQAIAIHTPYFFYKLFSGIHFFVYVSFGTIRIALNL